MSKSVKVLMAFMVDYVLLFCLIKTFNPFNVPIANYFKYWNWEAYFSPDPKINSVFFMSFFSLILFNIFIVKSIRGENNPIED